MLPLEADECKVEKKKNKMDNLPLGLESFESFGLGPMDILY